MKLAIFRKFVVLFFLNSLSVFGQRTDNDYTIELSASTFPIERPFTISVTIPVTENRASVVFPDIFGLQKRGISTRMIDEENDEKPVSRQLITQTYRATTTGKFRLAPFSITVGGITVHSPGAVLTVLPSQTGSIVSELEKELNGTRPGVASRTIPTSAPPVVTVPANLSANSAAFLALRPSTTSIYAGQGIELTLSFFVADTYPYTLDFKGLDWQLQAITRKIRPTNAWEESQPISELKPVPVIIKGKKYREVRLNQSIFFPLSTQPIRLPAVSLRLARTPAIGPPTATGETALFTSNPVVIGVKPLPPHPLRGRVPVGQFRLNEELDRQNIASGQSVRYTFVVSGEGNIATLPAPALTDEHVGIDIFPPEEKHSVHTQDHRVEGVKTFSYYLVPHQNGVILLANHFQWIYFDPRTARYDTLRPKIRLLVGTKKAGASGLDSTAGPTEISADGNAVALDNSLYAGLDALDSTQQALSVGTLVRAFANVLIVIMLVGMLFVLFKK